MRIGVDALSLKLGRTGGGETYLVQLLRHLAAVAVDHRLVVFGPPGLAERMPGESGNVEHVTWRAPGRGASALGARLLHEQVVLPRAIRRLRLDVMLFPANLMTLLCPVPAVLVIHDLASYHYAEHYPGQLDLVRGRLLPFLIGQSAKRASRIVADSEFTRQELFRRLEVPEERIDVVPLGIAPVPDAGSLPARIAGRPYVLFVGTRDSHKNLPALVEAFARLKQRRDGGFPHRLVLAGMSGTGSAALATRIARLGDGGGDVVDLGRVGDDELPGLYRNAAVFVFPSLYEGFGLPILEAMSAGVPVVASDRGACPEVAGDAALVVDATDVEALAAGIARVLDDTELAASLRARGRERADPAGPFGWKRVARRMLEVLDRVAAGAPARAT